MATKTPAQRPVPVITYSWWTRITGVRVAVRPA
jgi:hypothetical protein